MATGDTGNPSVPVPLEEVLLSFEKALSRLRLANQQLARSNSDFALGERPVYFIDSLDVELTAGLSVKLGATDEESDRVLIDVQAPSDERSTIRFRVGSKPVEIPTGARLEIALLDAPNSSRPRVRVWLIDDAGFPQPGREVRLYFARAGGKPDIGPDGEFGPSRDPVTAVTDSVGRVEFTIFAEKDYVKVLGDRKRHKVYLKGRSFRGEYFVWATSPRREDWDEVYEPPAPRPPFIAPPKEGQPSDILYTELLQLTHLGAPEETRTNTPEEQS